MDARAFVDELIASARQLSTQGRTIAEDRLGIPAAGSLLIAITGRIPNLRELMTLTTAVALFATVMHLLARVLRGERPEATLVEMFGGFEIAFKIEPLGMLFATVASTLLLLLPLELQVRTVVALLCGPLLGIAIHLWALARVPAAR